MESLVNIALAGFLVWSGGITGAPEAYAQSTLSAPASAPETYSVRLTGYNAVPEQTDNNPDITASGANSNSEVVIARSRDLANALPYGTIVLLETPKQSFSCGFKQVNMLIGYRVIADTMHWRKTNQIDVMFDKKDTVRLGDKDINPAVALGVCDVTLRVVGKIEIKNIPSTQAELALLVNPKLALK